MRILAAQINPTIGDIDGNCHKILSALKRAKGLGVDIVLFPELSLCGYFPDDLLLDRDLIEACEKKLEVIRPETKGFFVAVGLPRLSRSKIGKPLTNSAAVFANGELLGFKHKTLLPTYDVFDERRFFEPGGSDQPIWEYRGKKIGITICEDAWQHAQAVKETYYDCDPIIELKKKRPDLVLNLSGSPFYFERRDARKSVFQAAAQTLNCPIVFCNQVGANDQLIFDGHSLAVDSKGELIAIAKGFEEDDFILDLKKQKTAFFEAGSAIQDVHNALVLGVRDYFHKQGLKKALIGLSGGIDSAVCACIGVEALGQENVWSYTLPSRFTSNESLQDAHAVAKNLGIAIQEISIDETFQHFIDLLEPKFTKKEFDITEENLQARIRMMILMAFSNKEGPIMLYPGDKSEIAMGFTTLYGDLAGGLGVLLDVTKSRVYQIGRYINEKKKIIPERVFSKAPTPELKKGQKAADTLPRYELLDPIIEDYIEEQLSAEEIAKKRKQPLEMVQKIIHQIHMAEYKRRQAPIGLRMTQKAFAKGRYVPIVQKWK